MDDNTDSSHIPPTLFITPKKNAVIYRKEALNQLTLLLTVYLKVMRFDRRTSHKLGDLFPVFDLFFLLNSST